MLLTISTDHSPASDLGFLLHKNPGRLHSTDMSFGTAHVVFPEASDSRCTAAIIVEVDSVGLVRSRRGTRHAGSLFDYVSDRPYTANSYMSAAISKMFGTALSGRSKERPDLAATPISIELAIPVVACRGGSDVLERLFAPLGWDVESEIIEMDSLHPEWGDSPYRSVRLRGQMCLKDALEHIYVLLPVLDGSKHYWVNADEIDRLLRRGGAWLASHPERDFITRRYLRHDRQLTSEALERLAELDETAPEVDATDDSTDRDEAADAAEAAVEERISLNEQRMNAVVAAVQAASPRSVVDLGCGEGRLLGRLLRDTSVDRILGVDVSYRSLTVAARRLRLDGMAPRQRERIELRQGGLTYLDASLAGFDVACLIEVIEHIEPWRLDALERTVFGEARPSRAIVTTPNIEYNVRFEGMTPGRLRHADHRFEWTRAEFAEWTEGVASRNGYSVAFAPIGPDDPEVGSPTQMAVFSR
ncbi:MAG TPA: 3' terminal RNA ribose 2'-O-methyltransferase Hen1 [Microthrixaceae bacterium]|nr:3' terminal RNA ribose 2'-O-methyltransferase Hen1 [Microthrixaceae bacterium]HMT24214.1 3' terminal RNA ribose 2'-O-methyltransferase Hen1 [Microthrixaceae bacterium]HMT61682.1 3' terminal RNA ribose 2'-O-methyltransferase Hen1 [Microthrixaceae bacterium]